mgnify:FL=1
MNELVLAVSREALGVGTESGIFPIDLNSIDSEAYALLPRHIADNKSDSSVALGKLFPQILGYVQLVNEQGEILSYARKGKEKGLHGLRSIGVGGHVSHEELVTAIYRSDDPTQLPKLTELIQLGLRRELLEEVGIDIGTYMEANQLLVSDSNITSQVHVGLPMQLNVVESDIILEESEFLDARWISVEELKATVDLYEPWSQLIIQHM